jgi:hypothetical protein
VWVWIGLGWLRIETVGGHLWMRQWNFGFHKMWGISWLCTNWLASQGGSCFRVLDTAVGLYLFSFCIVTTFYNICIVLFCVAFPSKGWSCVWVYCSNGYFVLRMMSQILILFCTFVSIFIFATINVFV